MKIYNTALKEDIMQIVKAQGQALLWDPEAFSQALAPYLTIYPEEVYLMQQAVDLGLFDVRLLNRHFSIYDHVSVLSQFQEIDEEDALYMVCMVQQIIEQFDWDIMILNLDETVDTALDHGDGRALYTLALGFYDGLGVAQDFEKAYDLFEKSYQQGYMQSCYYLGKMNQYGLGTEEDKEQAKAYYLKGEKAEMHENAYGLGLLAEEDQVDPIPYYDESDLPAAAFAAGNYYLSHHDEAKAMMEYFRGAKQLDPECMNAYGKIYMRSGGLHSGLKYITYAYYAGNEDATEYLGYLFVKGEGVEKNVGRGLELLKQAADMGSEKAKELMSIYEAV